MSALASASLDELLALHKKQTKLLDSECSAKIKKAKGAAGKNKAKQKEVGDQITVIFDNKRAELVAAQQTEISLLAPSDDSAVPDLADMATLTLADPAPSEEEDPVAAKKEKARLKKQKKKDAEAARTLAIETEMANAGPSNRVLETNTIVTLNNFDSLGLSISDIKADGHCLYRSIAAAISQDYTVIRSLAADVLDAFKDDYAPFAMDDEGTPFHEYCDKVRQSAEWGGELELRAIARGLKRRIRVFNATPNPIVVEEEGASAEDEIMLSYHLSYYDLGAHYNLVIRK